MKNLRYLIISATLIFTFSCKKVENKESKKSNKIVDKGVPTPMNKKNVKKKKPAKSNVKKKKPAKSIKKVAVLTLIGNIGEKKNDSPFKGKTTPLTTWIKRIKKYGTDDTISSLIIYISSFNAPLTYMWELREAVKFVKKQGKKVYIYSDFLDSKTYFLASAGEKIGVNPIGSWEVIGLATESIFLKDFLAQFGIKADFIRMGKYKGAAETLTRSSMSPELKQSMQELIDSFYNELVSTISKARKIDPEKIKKLMDDGPLTAKFAKANGLVDYLGSFNDFVKKYSNGKPIVKFAKKKKKKPSLLSLLSQGKKSNEIETPHIALLIASGEIIYGAPSKQDIFSKDNQIASNDMVKELEKLKTNPYVKGVIIRINSPGGSALASEIIWSGIHELAKKKPVVASMGPYAASGGYYIASAAQKIFATPFTLTGSIGVIGGKMVLQNTYTKFKLYSEITKRGKNSSYYTQSLPFSDSERKAIKTSMLDTYDVFKKRVKMGRPNIKNVEKIAQGRVWGGLSAHKVGLVDQIGGLVAASNTTKLLAKVDKDTPVVFYPRPKPWYVALGEAFGGDDGDEILMKKLINHINPNASYSMSLYNLLKKERVLLLLPYKFSGF
jgi:protease IV